MPRYSKDNMRSCFYCEHEQTVFDGRTGRHSCLKGHKLKLCSDYLIKPIWESRRGADGFLLPREQWPDVIESRNKRCNSGSN